MASALAAVLVVAGGVNGVLHSGPVPAFPLEFRPRSLSLAAHLLEHGKLERRGQAAIDRLQLAEGSYNLIAKIGQVNLRVGIDTGSSDSWVVASSSPEALKVSLPTYPVDIYSPSFASVENNSTVFSISYADATSSQGFVARDTFVFENFSLPAQAFGLVEHTNVSLGSGQDGVSGVLGFGFPRLSSITQNVENAPPIMERLAQEGQLQYPLFGASLAGQTSTLSLGAIDVDVVKNISAIEWHDVARFGHIGKESSSSPYLQWALQLTSIAVDTVTIDITPVYSQVGERPLALLDVGSSGFFGPYTVVAQLFDAIQDSRIVSDGVWALPCDTTAQMHFNFGGATFTLGPQDYIIGEASGTPGICLSWPLATPPSSDGIDWSFGAPFLRTVYSVFSFGIVGREPPLIGLYPIPRADSLGIASSMSRSFSSSSSPTTMTTLQGSSSQGALRTTDSPTTTTFPIVDTTLPNTLVATPSFTTPPYLFNTTTIRSASAGATSGFGTSTYSPALRPLHMTAIPTIALPVSTLVTTDTQGHAVTTTVLPSAPPVVLGRPSGAIATRPQMSALLFTLTLFFSRYAIVRF